MREYIPGQMFTKSYGSSFLTDSTCFGTEYQLYACADIHKGLNPLQGGRMQHLATVQEQGTRSCRRKACVLQI